MRISNLWSFVAFVQFATTTPVLLPVSEVKVVRYGPYTLKRADGTAASPHGVKTTILSMSVQKPCEHCTLVSISGGVQNTNGSEAAAPAVNLHHAALINTGPAAKDGTCASPGSDLFFSTGNERSVIYYNNANATTQSGYYVQHSDNFLLQSEVINNEFEEKEIWVYMKYQYILGKQQDQQQTKVVWLSADGTVPCERKINLLPLPTTDEHKLEAGEVIPPNNNSFTLKSAPWTSPWNGNFIALGGHLHDGGINVAIFKNEQLLCDSKANYGTEDSMSMEVGHSSSAGRHISSIDGCASSDAVKAGDKFHIVVKYDFERYPGMRDKYGKLMPIMGAATLFIGANEG